jgi:hypothetical protein
LAAARFHGGPPFSFALEAHADRGEGPPEGVVQPPPLHFEAPDAHGERRADSSRRRAAAQDHARGVPERNLQRQAGRVLALGIPSVQDRERRRLRADRGAELEGARDRFPAENRAPENPVRAHPCGEAATPGAPGEGAERPTSPRLAPIGGEIQPLDP